MLPHLRALDSRIDPAEQNVESALDVVGQRVQAEFGVLAGVGVRSRRLLLLFLRRHVVIGETIVVSLLALEVCARAVSARRGAG